MLLWSYHSNKIFSSFNAQIQRHPLRNGNYWGGRIRHRTQQLCGYHQAGVTTNNTIPRGDFLIWLRVRGKKYYDPRGPVDGCGKQPPFQCFLCRFSMCGYLNCRRWTTELLHGDYCVPVDVCEERNGVVFESFPYRWRARCVRVTCHTCAVLGGVSDERHELSAGLSGHTGNGLWCGRFRWSVQPVIQLWGLVEKCLSIWTSVWPAISLWHYFCYRVL